MSFRPGTLRFTSVNYTSLSVYSIVFGAQLTIDLYMQVFDANELGCYDNDEGAG